MKTIIRCLVLVDLCGILMLSLNCNQSTDTDKNVNNVGYGIFNLFPNIPTNITLSGIFQSETDKLSYQQTSSINFVNVAVSFLPIRNWYNSIAVTFNTYSVTNPDQRISMNPPSNHIWHVDSNASLGIPQIDDTLSAVQAFEITAPSWFDSTAKPFTVYWTSPTVIDTNIRIGIFIDRVINTDTSFTINDFYGKRLVDTEDDGSYSFTQDQLDEMISGSEVHLIIVRYHYKIREIDKKNFLFVNYFQNTNWIRIK